MYINLIVYMQAAARLGVKMDHLKSEFEVVKSAWVCIKETKWKKLRYLK